jgi:hypothetical protein
MAGLREAMVGPRKCATSFAESTDFWSVCRQGTWFATMRSMRTPQLVLVATIATLVACSDPSGDRDAASVPVPSGSAESKTPQSNTAQNESSRNPDGGAQPSPNGNDSGTNADRDSGLVTGADSGGSTSTTADAGSSSSSSGCGPNADLFCDDFESYAAGPLTAGAKWTSEVTNGSFAVSTTTKRGQKSLQVQTTGNGRALAWVKDFAPPGNSFFGRMQIWMKAFPSAPQYAHWTMFESMGVGADRIRPIGGQLIPGQGSEKLWGTGADGGPTGDWTRWSATAPAEAGKWVCMEWQQAASNNEMHVWVDGTAKPALDVSTKVYGQNGGGNDFKIPTITRAWFGWWLYQGNPTPGQFEVFIDDVALGSKRLGC